MSARAHLESLLRSRKLDRTLTSALPSLDPRDELAVAPTGIHALDAQLGGGFPRGQLSELVGSQSSGRTSVLLRMMAAAAARGEILALVDTLDRFDVASGEAAGVDLNRLLWIRGHVVANPGLCRDTNQRALEQAVKALTLVLQAGNVGLVAFDVADAPPEAIRRLPFTTWLRLQRIVEGSQTVCVLVGSEPMARSSAGLTMQLGRRSLTEGLTRGARFRGRLFNGLAIEARVIRARAGFSSVGVTPERNGVRASASGGGAPEVSPVGVTPERNGVRASASGGGAPRVLENVCVSLSTICA